MTQSGTALRVCLKLWISPPSPRATLQVTGCAENKVHALTKMQASRSIAQVMVPVSIVCIYLSTARQSTLSAHVNHHGVRWHVQTGNIHYGCWHAQKGWLAPKLSCLDEVSRPDDIFGKAPPAEPGAKYHVVASQANPQLSSLQGCHSVPWHASALMREVVHVWHTACKQLMRQGVRVWRTASKQLMREGARVWRSASKQLIREGVRVWHTACKQLMTEGARVWRTACKQLMKEGVRVWRTACKQSCMGWSPAVHAAP